MIIPLGPGSLRDSSSLPEGQSAALFQAQHIRAGPALPSYLALLHAGFSVPRMSPPGRWALTPPFHPCQMRLTERGRPLVLPQACRRGASITGGFIFYGTFRSRVPWRKLSLAISNRDQPPGVTRRVALLWPTLASSPQLESGLSSRPLPFRETNRRSSDSPATTIIAPMRMNASLKVPASNMRTQPIAGNTSALSLPFISPRATSQIALRPG
jgi:hypothetical protein